MIIDKDLEFSDGQAITADAKSTDVYDSQATPVLKDIGLGTPLYLVVQIDANFNLLTTLEATLQSDSTSDLATSPTNHISTGAIPLASLVAGAQFIVPLPPGDYERYVGINYDVVGTNPSQGAISAFITTDPQRNIAYPDAL